MSELIDKSVIINAPIQYHKKTELEHNPFITADKEKYNEISTNPKYIMCLDHGFVGLVDHMGSDAAIVQAARVSYGEGTKTVREDRGLIRYLMRQRHTSPFEMCEVKFHIRLPIFVMRQLVRHRTSSLNEYSGRYSEMSKEFYIPELTDIKRQDASNKQGSGDMVSMDRAHDVQTTMKEHYNKSYLTYQNLLGNILSDVPGPDGLFTPTDEGISKELARLVLPVANYTECYWKQDLHNLFHLLKLRYDDHAQYEIRVFAKAIYDIIKPLFPMAVEAWEDYQFHSSTFSRMDMNLLTDIIKFSNSSFYNVQETLDHIIATHHGRKNTLEYYNMTIREWNDLLQKLGLIERYNAFLIQQCDYPLLKSAIIAAGVNKRSERFDPGHAENFIITIETVNKEKFNEVITSLQEIIPSVQPIEYMM